MDQAITLKMVLLFIGIPVALLGVAGVLLLIVSLLNPFRSGH